MDVFAHAPASRGAKDYKDLLEELVAEKFRVSAGTSRGVRAGPVRIPACRGSGVLCICHKRARLCQVLWKNSFSTGILRCIFGTRRIYSPQCTEGMEFFE